MDLDQLPVPPADPNASWEELPAYFQACADILADVFDQPPPEPPERFDDSPEVALTTWLNLSVEEDKDCFITPSPGQIRRVTVIPANGGWMICIPQHMERTKKQLVRDLLSNPSSRTMTFRGTEALEVAEWLMHFLSYLHGGFYQIAA